MHDHESQLLAYIQACKAPTNDDVIVFSFALLTKHVLN